MFPAFLGLAALIMWVAVELYFQAQRQEAGDAANKEQTRKSHEYLKAQMPRGCNNVNKTIAVGYDDLIDSGSDDWEEEMVKTQMFSNDIVGNQNPKSGTRQKQR